METVPRVAGVEDKRVGIVTVILDLIAVTGNAWFLAAYQVKTWTETERSHRRRDHISVLERHWTWIEQLVHPWNGFTGCVGTSWKVTILLSELV